MDNYREHSLGSLYAFVIPKSLNKGFPFTLHFMNTLSNTLAVSRASACMYMHVKGSSRSNKNLSERKRVSNAVMYHVKQVFRSHMRI